MNKKADRFIRQLNRDRRNFLEMLGKAGVAPSIFKMSGLAAAALGSQYARAAAKDDYKLIMIYHPNGSPDGKYLNGAAMTPFNGAHRDNVSVLEMSITSPGGHGNLFQAAGATSYTARNLNSSSIDFQAASVLNAKTPKGVLATGVFSEKKSGINRDKASDVSRFNDPAAAFRAMFGDGAPAAGGGGGSSADPVALEQRRSVLDINKAGMELIRNKLGQEERERFESHLSGIAELEKQLEAEEALANNGAACNAPSRPGASGSALKTYKSHGDIIVAAMECGLTNVASIQFSETQASWYANDGTADAVDWKEDHHKANHAGGVDKLPELLGYMNKGIAHLITQLKAAQIFDKTVIVCFSEMGDGQNHTQGNGPIVVASGIPGFKQKRQNIRAGDHTRIFSDVFQLLNLESAVGNTIYDYGNAGIVV